MNNNVFTKNWEENISLALKLELERFIAAVKDTNDPLEKADHYYKLSARISGMDAMIIWLASEPYNNLEFAFDKAAEDVLKKASQYL